MRRNQFRYISGQSAETEFSDLNQTSLSTFSPPTKDQETQRERRKIESKIRKKEGWANSMPTPVCEPGQRLAVPGPPLPNYKTAIVWSIESLSTCVCFPCILEGRVCFPISSAQDGCSVTTGQMNEWMDEWMNEHAKTQRRKWFPGAE